MYFKLVARTGAVVFSALAVTGVAAASAMAASNTAKTYSGPSLCIKGTATQYPANSGFSSRWAPTDAEPYTGDCATPLSVSQGNVATKADVYKWNGSTWAYCTGTGWVYGGYTSGHWGGDIYYPPTYGASTSSYAGSCGAGYYGVNGAAYVWANPYNTGYQWNGGWVWSGYEYIG